MSKIVDLLYKMKLIDEDVMLYYYHRVTLDNM
jgi:hypothetical protein